MSPYSTVIGWLLLACSIPSLSYGHSIPTNRIDDAEMHPISNRGSLPFSAKSEDYEDAELWFESAQGSLEEKLREIRIEKKAKNLIMFVGDGMGVSTVTAARIFKGQLEELKFGEEGQLHMDTFPYIGASKTYCSNWQVADSACSSTAYFSGTKANAGTSGVKPSVSYDNCTTQMQKEHQVSSILEWAQAAGMSTGIVTTTTVTHASPSGAYAHIANRNWENDAKVSESEWDSEFCDDIAEQLILHKPGVDMNVILGGGREHLTTIDTADVELPEFKGKREDGKDLTTLWIQGKAAENHKAQYLTSRKDLLNLDITKIDYLLGLFSPSHVAYADKQLADDDPSLAEMTDVAIKILSKNPKGFFLFVEGGRIDQAHHSNNGKRAIVETLQFDDAIKLADEKTVDDETLIVVTADHSHLFTLAGDPMRGNPILQLSGNYDNRDNLPFTTLAYINGNGYREPQYNGSHCIRADISQENVEGIEYLQTSQVPRGSATHAGEDVFIFAKGPFAHLFTGVNEQSFIPHGMAYAACISPFSNNFCKESDNSAYTIQANVLVWLLSSLISFYSI